MIHCGKIQKFLIVGREALLDKCIKILDDFTYSVIRRREAEIVEARESGRKIRDEKWTFAPNLNYAAKYLCFESI